MNNQKRIWKSERWILSPYVRVIIGDNRAVIYDFQKEKAYQTSKLMGKFLNEVFSKSNRVDQELLFKHWMMEIAGILSEEKIIRELNQYIDKLKKLGILVPLNKFIEKDVLIPALERNPPFQPPYLCSLELTSRCNFRCPHCYLGDKSSPQDLEFNSICSLLQQIKKIGIQVVHLTGGEIFLRKDAIEILRITHDMGLEIEIATNGSLLSEDIIEALERYVKKIQITIYGFRKEIYLLFSGDSTVFNKVFSNIDKLQKRKPDILELAFTITPYNYLEVDEFFRYSNEKGLKSKIGKTLPIGLALNIKKALLRTRYNTFLEELERKYVKKGGFLIRTRPCSPDRLAILADGRAVICSLARESRFTLGNIYYQTLEDIWYKKGFPFIESLHVDNIEICKTCELKYLCGGGCPTLWQPLKSKSPSCRIYYNYKRKYVLKSCEF